MKSLLLCKFVLIVLDLDIHCKLPFYLKTNTVQTTGGLVCCGAMSLQPSQALQGKTSKKIPQATS